MAANQKLCFTQVTGLPHKVSDNPPQWDFPDNPPNLTVLNDQTNFPVDPDSDTGWFDAYRLAFEPGTGHNDGTMQAIAQNNHGGIANALYFSFKVFDDSDLDLYDAVVIALDNRGGQNATQQYTWIVIQPFTAVAGQQNNISPTVVDPNFISVWTASNLVNGQPSWTPVLNYPWIRAVFAVYSVPNQPKTWYVVVRIDNSNPAEGPNLPLTNTFGTLLDTVATQTDGMDRQFAFPTTLQLTDRTSATSNNPDPTQWADATQGGGCSGVHFDSGDITNTVSGSLSSVISTNHTNNFAVTVHNSDSALAGQIRATFRIANFGIPSTEWQLLGTNPVGGTNDSVGNNPTTRQNVPKYDVLGIGACTDAGGGHDSVHNGCITFTAGPWNLGTDNVNYYSQAIHEHQCVRVDLDSPAGVTFINSSSWNNFDFKATMSKFVSPPAFISGHYPAVPDHRQSQIFDLYVSQEVPKTGQSGVGPAVPSTAAATRKGKEPVTSTSTLVVHGCRHTGKFVTIDPPTRAGKELKPKKFENCENVGSYGYGITHHGPSAITNWTYRLYDSNGKELPRAGGVYQLNVPQDGVSTVTTTVEGKESGISGKFAVFADFGAAIPNGTFGNVVNTGFSFNAGLEYIFNPHVSAEAILGVHHFPGKIAGDVTAVQFGGGAKVFLNPGHPNLVFARAGAAGYHFTSGTTNAGGYFGAGFLHEFNAHLGLEAVYTFHVVNTPVAATKFSTVQGGVRYAF